jgi:hypothetical protein
MCGYHNPLGDLMYLAAGVSVIGFDVVVALKSVFQWTKRRGLQSFNALGLGAAAICTLGGAIYGSWDMLSGVRVPMFVGLSIAMALALFPLINFLCLKNKGGKQLIWRIPIVLSGLLFALAFFQACLYAFN